MTKYVALFLATSIFLLESCQDGRCNGADCEDSSGIGEVGGETNPDLDSGTTISGTGSGTGTETQGMDTSGSSDTGGTTTGNESNCGESKFEATLIPPNVMLVLDKSGSMRQNEWLDGGVKKTRWASLHGTVQFLATEFGNSVNFGAKLFPHLNAQDAGDHEQTCGVAPQVEVPVAPNNAMALLDGLPGVNASVSGGTPANSGLNVALEYLHQLQDGLRKVVILVMDGRISCEEEDADLRQTAAQAFADGIPVYVVGIDIGSDPDVPNLDAILDSLAMAGGTEHFYNSSDANALRQAMTEIVGQISSCVIPLDPSPPYFDRVKAAVDGGDIPWITDHSTCESAMAAGLTTGWVYTRSDPYNEVELCGLACDQFVQTAKVNFVYECPPPG